jgi:uncharacterized protein
MRLVLDTNVFVSGVFFKGPPYDILDAWRRGKVEMVISPEILEEYSRTGTRLSEEFGGVDLAPWLRLASSQSTLVISRPLGKQVCSDPDDDKFLACALACGGAVVVSGDRALLRVSGYKGIRVLSPRQFVDENLTSQ